MQDNTCVCCGRIIPEGRHICLSCGSYDDMQTFRPSSRAYYPEPPKVTNGDRIRAMSDAQLVEFIITALSAKAIECDYCIHRDEVCMDKRPSRRCAIGMIEWLRSEVRNE